MAFHTFPCKRAETPNSPRTERLPEAFPLRQARQRNPNQQDEVKGYASLPCVKGVSERVQRILQHHNIKTTLKPVKSLRQILSKPKDTIPMSKRTGVVYNIPCKDCAVSYIGETGRALKTRTKEHEACVRLGKTESSALSDHANSNDHGIAWDDIKISATESRKNKRRWT
ncbi:hypothetical protein AC249_AIPGENE18003 [Exaiptasia diaphana]|nr:hypothetical protein AC249_AIPGENE18003 [Exaiptasia diaphana]